MEIDALIKKHTVETEEARKAGTLDTEHSMRQVRELICHALYMELQRNSLRDAIAAHGGLVVNGYIQRSPFSHHSDCAIMLNGRHACSCGVKEPIP